MKTQLLSKRIIFVTIGLSITYAILRYHVLGPIPWKDLPFFILNKGIALSAFILLTFNFALGPLKNLGINVSEAWLQSRRALGMTSFLLVLLHALMSFLLFKPEVYAIFFESDGTLSLLGGISMLGGVLAFIVLWGYNLSFQTHLSEDRTFIMFITSRKFLLWVLPLGAVHLFFMGYKGWLTPSQWHGGLPPISLIGFSFFTFGYVINLLGRK